MSWIKVINEDEADGRLKELYDQYAEPDGSVDLESFWEEMTNP